MRLNSNTKHINDTMVVKIMCVIMFCMFTFFFLYAFQADLLFAAQHHLSHGQTKYDSLIGASIITLVLLLVSLVLDYFVKVNQSFCSLVFVPSLLLLGFLTSFNYDFGLYYDASWTLALSALVVWLLGLIFIKTKFKYVKLPVVKCLWINTFILSFMFFVTALMSNGNSVLHIKLKTERLLLNRDYSQAVSVGCLSNETDKMLSVLRVYSFSKKDILADSLFTVPINCTSSDIFPFDTLSTAFYPTDSIFRHLGALPRGNYNSDIYKKVLIKTGLAKKSLYDYILIGNLIDCDLNLFYKNFADYYTINDSLPMHYKEALIISSAEGICNYNIPADSLMQNEMLTAIKEYKNGNNSSVNTDYYYLKYYLSKRYNK